MTTPRFLAAAARTHASADAVAVLGLPYDGAVTYRGGARLGPTEIRRASDSIETYCPKLRADLEDITLVDLGDLDPVGETPAAVLAGFSKELDGRVDRGTPVLCFGGDHLVAYAPLVRAIAQHPDLLIFHIDAHTDLRESWEGEPYNHATVMRRVLDQLPHTGALWSWGIRSGLRSEFALCDADPRITLLPRDAAEVSARLEAVRASGRPIYVTLDVDGIDPADIPGTGTPEPDGLGYGAVEDVLLALAGGAPDRPPARVVGADLVEFAPPLDPTGRSAVACARLARGLLLVLGAAASATLPR